MRDGYKHQRSIRKAVKNKDIDLFVKEYKDYYRRKENIDIDTQLHIDDNTVFENFSELYKDIFFKNTAFIINGLIYKLDEELLLHFLDNYKAYKYDYSVFNALSEETQKKYLYSIIKRNDFMDRLARLPLRISKTDLVTFEYVNELIKNHKLEDFLKCVIIRNEELNNYIMEYLIEHYGKRIIVDLINNHTSSKYNVFDLIKNHILSKRPNYDERLDNDYYNGYYYYPYYDNDDFTYVENSNYINVYNVISSYMEKYSGFDNMCNQFELVLESDDRFLITYYCLLYDNESVIENDYLLEVICKTCNYKNKQDFKKFVDYYISKNKEYELKANIKPILKYRIDLYDIQGFDYEGLYEIGDKSDAFDVIMENIDELKEKVENFDFDKESKRIKHSNDLLMLKMKFKNTLKLIDTIEDEYDMHQQVSDLYNILIKANCFYDDNLSALYIANNVISIDYNLGIKIVNYILGDANEVDINRIKLLKEKIKKIKYLDDCALVKITNLLLSTNDYDLILSFLDNISRCKDISILSRTISNTNDKILIADYIYHTKDEKLLKTKFVDLDNYKKYCDDNNIRNDYEVRIKFKS